MFEKSIMKNRIYLQGFDDKYPFVPTCKEVIYIPFSGSSRIDDFFKRNLDEVKALFMEKLKYTFIYIPDLVKKYGEIETLRYYHPLAENPSAETIHFVEQELINSLLHNDDGKKMTPGLVHFMQTELFREFEGEHQGCFEFSYFPLKEDSDANMMATLCDYVAHCGEAYGHINYGHSDIWKYSEADRSFYSAQEMYFDLFKDKDVRGITRYVLDNLVDEHKISHIEVLATGDILLSDYGIKIEMCPVAKAIYLLFLRHPEGIVFANLPQYSDELAIICEQLCITKDEDLQVAAYSLNPDLDLIDQICGEIYSNFREKLDKKTAAPYIIQASPYDFEIENRMPYLEIGEPKKILLDRNLVIWNINLNKVCPF